MNRSSIKWHKSLINIGADPATRTIVHKMGPLLIPLKPMIRDGKECLPITIHEGQSKFPVSKAIPVADLLTQCGVE
jgi:hypothetical protein